MLKEFDARVALVINTMDLRKSYYSVSKKKKKSYYSLCLVVACISHLFSFNLFIFMMNSRTCIIYLTIILFK